MKILITGGAGFIGGNHVHYLLENYPQDDVVCVDNLTYAGNMETLASAFDNPNFYFEKADISDKAAIREIFDLHKPDCVINYAAESHVDRSIENPGVFLTTNILGTQVLLDACREFSVQRYHQVSTDEVYGDLPLDRPDMRFTEQTPLHTSSPYSASKAGADLLCFAYMRTYNVPITISRCSNNYGPYHFPEKLIPLMIINAMRDKPLPVYGKGENVRDWLYVTDHCRAVDMIMRKGTPGEIYNIGGNCEWANIDVVREILRQLDKPDSLIKYVTDRPGHDLRYAIDATKIKNDLGWEPQVTFEQGLSQTIEWYKNNREWWEHVQDGEYQLYYERMYLNRDVKKSEQAAKDDKKISIPKKARYTIIVTGSDGQLGSDVVAELRRRNVEHFGVDIAQLDITDAAAVEEYIGEISRTAEQVCVIHCAAYTAVDKAEDESERCFKVNAEGTENIAKACHNSDAEMIYISTDYVFGGEGEAPYEVNSDKNPKSVYGESKLAGEVAVKKHLEKYYIVRISWVFGKNGQNFVKAMLNRCDTYDKIKVVDDQVGSPTYTQDLAGLLCDMALSGKYGEYHATNEGYCSWAEFAQEIMRICDKPCKIIPITTQEYPTRAQRPLNSRLSKKSIDEAGFERLPIWQDALRRYLEEGKKQDKQEGLR